MNAPLEKNLRTFAEDDLAGRLLAVMVSCMEGQKLAWPMMSEKNQQIVLNKYREIIRKAVMDAVTTIATQRRPAIPLTIGKVTFEDDSIKCQISLAREAAGRHDLADHTGHTAVLILANPEKFIGGMEKVAAEKDQKALDLESKQADYEIKQEKDETYTIYKDKSPMVGGKGFPDQQSAEKWLQDHLGLTKKKDEKKTDGAAQAAQTPPSPPPPDLEEAKKAVRAAAKAAAAAEPQGDFDDTWKAAVKDYPADWVEEYYAELQEEMAAGWQDGTDD